MLLALTVGGTPALTLGAQADAPKKKGAQPATPAAHSTDLKKIQGEIRQLRSTLDAARNRQEELRTKLRATETDMGKTSHSLKKLQQQLQRHTRELQQLHQRQQQHQAQLSAHRATLAQQLRANYAMGHQDFLKIVLNQQDPAVLGRTLGYYEYFHRARITHIDNITENLAELETLEQTTQEQARRLAQSQAETEQTQKELEKSRKKRSVVLAALNNEIQNKEQRLQQLLEDERELAKLLKRLRDAQKRVKPAPKPGQPTPPTAPRDKDKSDPGSAFGRLKGKLAWPAQGPLAAHYGTSRKLGTSKWQGVLIAAPEGAEVRAIARGRVVFADWMRGFGLLMIVDHDDGYMTLYGQNQSLNKGVGDPVEGGDVIASVGNSGGQMDPGLYFEIRRDGTPVNPASWCR